MFKSFTFNVLLLLLMCCFRTLGILDVLLLFKVVGIILVGSCCRETSILSKIRKTTVLGIYIISRHKSVSLLNFEKSKSC